MKHGSITTRLNKKNRQVSGQQPVKAIQSDQILKRQLARLWRPNFGMHIEFLFIDYFEKGKTIKCEYYMALLDRLNEKNKEKSSSNAKEKRAVSSRQCSMPQVHENNGKIVRIMLRINFPPTVQSRSSPQ
ncbi:hypothetical protein TNCV_101951 [Trichonephila clavipes]|nr:hypothetical protein TNCV_101951 [Trichonephila clavipes]